MKLWITSDWHLETFKGHFNPRRPEFDVLVCAGDVHVDIVTAIEMVAAIAGDRPAVFVAGNHEFWGDIEITVTLDRGHAAARKAGIAFLELDSVDIGGVRFAGATLWGERDPRHMASVKALAASRCDVAVTHFEPTAKALSLVGAELWIHGHHHGFEDRQIGRTRLVRNAAPWERVPDGPPATPDFVVEIAGSGR
jgi:predicted phosphodiesterase